MRLRPDTLHKYHHYCHSSIYEMTTDLIDHGLRKGKLGDDDTYKIVYRSAYLIHVVMNVCTPYVLCMITVSLYPYIVRTWTNYLVLR